ncbi:MAG: glutathione S-transferase family protein [Magnetococcales bacterium]|nr:glutathione S-transferase family protein [Magnetococcales bacterium]
MKLELIGYKICPYVQRSVITALHKKADCTITYIQPTNKPEWFEALSPMGKVPILRVGDEATGIFESAVINELLDELTDAPRMLPEDPVERARCRAWIEFGSSCLGDLSAIATGADEEAHQAGIKGLNDKLTKLASMNSPSPYFNGAELSLVDTAFAPLFQRLMVLESSGELLSWASYPKVKAWSDTLLSNRAVAESLPEGAERLYRGYVVKRNGYLGQRMASASS